LKDYWNPADVWPENPSPILLRFKERIGTIYKAGYEQGLCPGEILQMINVRFGYYKADMPWGRMPEIRTWISKNAYRSFELLSPNYHKILMQSVNPYSTDYLRQESLSRTPAPQTEW